MSEPACEGLSIKEIYAAARRLEDPGRRRAYLDEVCRHDPSLRSQVELLLSVPQKEGASPLDALADAFGPAETFATRPLDAPRIDVSNHPPIGPYKLLEQIGEGGMGIVYMALQEKPVRRKVALKIIKPGMDTRQVIARFEAERQALALMDHSHIARVLDAGATEAGRPYFVMELVHGMPITDYCNQEGLTCRQRLELFVDVCQAVQHAHQKGIIHRDLKPSNVLVTRQDGRPLVKVIDFGVAKAIGAQLTDKTLFTGFAQLIGTPLYMSPEQAALSNVDVDTRSDVYSLGVLLYELLTGTTPFDKATLAQAAYDELRRMIREDEPPRPSARVSTLKADALTTLAGRHPIDVQKLSRQLRGELDWIVMKALNKDRNRRYQSPSAFAADVERYLCNEPVEASPPATFYRLRKLAQRHRAALATTGLLAAVLVTATAISVWQALGATQASTEARAQRQQAEANLQTAREAVDRMLLRVADERLAALPSFEPVRRALLQDALEFYERLLVQQAGSPVLRLSSARASSKIANLHYLLGRWEQVRPAYEQSCRILEELRKENPDDRIYTKELAETYQALAFFEFHRGWSAESAEPFYVRALRLRTVLAQSEPDADEHQLALLVLRQNLMEVQERLGRTKLTAREKAERFREDLRICEDLVRRHPEDVAYRRELAGINVRFCLFQAKKQPEEGERMFRAAETILQETLEDAPTDQDVRRMLAWASSAWAHCLRQLDRHAEAEEAMRRAIAACEEVLRLSGNLPDDQALRANYRNQLGGDLESAGRLDEAENLYRQTLDEVDFHGMGQRRDAVERLARLLIKQQRYAEAAVHCQSLIDAAERDLLNEPDDTTPRLDLLTARLLLIEIHVLEGKPVEAARQGAALPRTLPKLGHYFTAAAVLVRTARLAEGDEHAAGAESSVAAAICRRRAKQLLDEASALLDADLKQSDQQGWYECYQLALCRLASGDQRGYRGACAEMLRRFGQSRNADALHFTAWSCSLGPGAVDDYAPLIAAARREVEARPSDAGALQALGAALFRAGGFEEARQVLTQADAAAESGRVNPAYAWFYLAMASHALGHRDESKTWFNKAAAHSEKTLAGHPSWNRRLTLELLQAEAAAMLPEPSTEALE